MSCACARRRAGCVVPRRVFRLLPRLAAPLESRACASIADPASCFVTALQRAVSDHLLVRVGARRPRAHQVPAARPRHRLRWVRPSPELIWSCRSSVQIPGRSSLFRSFSVLIPCFVVVGVQAVPVPDVLASHRARRHLPRHGNPSIYDQVFHAELSVAVPL